MLSILYVSVLLSVASASGDNLKTEVIYPKHDDGHETYKNYFHKPILVENEEHDDQSYVHHESSHQPGDHIPVFENPHYDPSMYATFIPRETVQQYVSSYGGPFFPKPHEHSYGVDWAHPPWNPPPPPYLSPHPIEPPHVFIDDPYFAPVPPPPPHAEVTPLTRTGSPFQIIKDLCPLSRLISEYYDVGAEVLITVCSFLLLASAVATMLCNFTSFCRLPVFPLLRTVVRDSDKSDRIDLAEQSLNGAIEKYKPKEQAAVVKEKTELSNTI